MPTTIEFFGGLREIGATKVEIATDRARVLLDIGLPIPDHGDLFRAPVAERPGRELADRLRVGLAPRLAGWWDPDQLAPDDRLRARDRRPGAVFISHGHIDHDGCLGFLAPGIDVAAHPDTVRLHQALRLAGRRWLGSQRAARAYEPVERVGDITVEGLRVDHDVPGASGYLVTTPDGTLAYTGDINFHRDGAPHSRAFAERVRGVDMLVTETTLLSFTDRGPQEPATEDDVFAGLAAAVARAPGLALVSVYERDVERCRRLIAEARAWGRTVIWPGTVAVLLAAMGVRGVATWDTSRPQAERHAAALARADERGIGITRASLAAVRAAPARYLVQLDADDLPALLDLPLRPGDPWLHVQGEPLGPFVPAWAPFVEWLDALGLERIELGSSGHASPAALEAFVADVAPGVVVPVHGWRPEALPYAGRRLIAEYGRRYDLRGDEIAAAVGGRR